MTPPIQAHFVLMDGTLTLDWAGPAEVLRFANNMLAQQGLPPAFGWDFISPRPHCTTSVGTRITDLAPLPELARAGQDGRAHWVVVMGQVGQRMQIDTPPARELLHWLRGLRLVPGQLELVCVCAGAILAAHAGLLHGRQATTHHEHLQELRQAEPGCAVQVNRVFTQDGAVWSSAGVTTGIDLMLHRVSQQCGAVVAAQVAQALVVALRRGPDDPEMSPFLQHRNHLHAAVHRVQDAVSQAPQQHWTLAQMAAVAHTSARHLTRLFAEHAGIPPQHYLRQIRLAVAGAALRSGRNVTQAAELAGFQSDTQLRRAWHAAGLPGSPSSGVRGARAN